MKTRIALAVVAVAFATLGCTKYVVVQGNRLQEDHWLRAEQSVRRTASFDLRCPADDLELQILQADVQYRGVARSIGVTGCGARAVYANANGTWVMNTHEGSPATTEADEAATGTSGLP